MDDILRQTFRKFADRWQEETKLYSWVRIDHLDYRRIVALGKPVVPFIFERMAEDKMGIHWTPALISILKKRPTIPTEACGNQSAVADIWLQWAKEEGYSF